MHIYSEIKQIKTIFQSKILAEIEFEARFKTETSELKSTKFFRRIWVSNEKKISTN